MILSGTILIYTDGQLWYVNSIAQSPPARCGQFDAFC